MDVSVTGRKTVYCLSILSILFYKSACQHFHGSSLADTEKWLKKIKGAAQAKCPVSRFINSRTIFHTCAVLGDIGSYTRQARIHGFLHSFSLEEETEDRTMLKASIAFKNIRQMSEATCKCYDVICCINLWAKTKSKMSFSLCFLFSIVKLYTSAQWEKGKQT